MLKNRYTPKLSMKKECVNDEGNVLTVVKLDSLTKIIDEYKESVKILTDPSGLVRMIVEALILYYCWNKDFIDHGTASIPKEIDMESTEEMLAREILIECIIKAMHDIDRFHPEMRTLCLNVTSLSVVRVQRVIVLLSLNINNGTVH